MQSGIEELEILAEYSSLYAEKIRNNFSKKELFEKVKKILYTRFKSENFPILEQNNDIIFLMLQAKLLTKIEGFLYHKEEFQKSMDSFSEDFLDNFQKELFFFYEEFLKNIGKDIYIFDAGIKKILIHIVTDNKRMQNLWNSLRKVIKNVHNNITKNYGRSKEIEFADYLLDGKILPVNLEEISFKTFLSDDKNINFICNIFNDFSNLIFPEKTKNHQLESNINNEENALELVIDKTRKRIKEIFNQVVDELDKYSILEFTDRLEKINDILKSNIGALRGIKSHLDEKDKIKPKKFYLPVIYNYLGHDIEKFLTDDLLIEIFKTLEKKKIDIPSKYLLKRMFKTDYDLEGLRKEMVSFYKDVFEPTLYSKIVESMVEIWPLTKYKKVTIEEARWVGLRGREGGVIVLPNLKLKENIIKNKNVLSDFANVISVLIYDIRGSSFMGNKLNNAIKEEEIRNKFQERLLEIVLRYGGFPIKDTGDGGIILFSSNSNELYTTFVQYRMGKSDINREQLALLEGNTVAKNAVLCARDMVIEARNFVKDNLKNYEDWFKQVEGFKIQFAGITYDELPPSIKRIFQIGIGIASGRYGKDISFNINTFGEPDLTGNLVREANLYSKIREKDSSTIIIDLKTFLSLLISLEEFFPEDIKDEKLSTSFAEDIYTKEMKIWYFGIRGRYILKKYNTIINRVFSKIYFDESENLEDVSIKEEGIGNAQYSKIFDKKVEKEKEVYKIIVK
uniref:Uncharacterized protein n=1 Tax=candidate division WOR-3 bacterium TaxID=2052148 RepID=A0A7C4Y600_UNCW3